MRHRLSPLRRIKAYTQLALGASSLHVFHLVNLLGTVFHGAARYWFEWSKQHI